MRSSSETLLKRVGAQDVETWLRAAWPDQHHYPGKTQCGRLADQVNTIVDRHNAAAERSAANAAMRARRDDCMASQKFARALSRELPRTLDKFRDELTMITADVLAPVDGACNHHITVTEQLLTALEDFLALPAPPKVVEHIDNILWIERAVDEAWDRIQPGSSDDHEKMRFSPRPDGPLVDFISLVLEATGLGSRDQDGMISDHLRQRHNRARPPRKSQRDRG